MRSLFIGVVCLLLAGPLWAQSATYREDLEVGQTFYELGQYDRAEKYLSRAYKSAPKQAEAAVPYGVTLHKLGKHEEAIAVLSVIKAKGDLEAEAAFYLGESQKALGDTEAARASYRRAVVAGGPLGSRALLESGRLSSSLGDYETAKSDFQRLLQLESASELAAEAKAGLAEVESRRKGRYAASIDLGVRYDTNVRLAEEPASGDAGIRSVINAQGRFRAVNTGRFRSDLAFAVNQGRYLAKPLQSLDLGVQRLNVDSSYKLAKLPVRIAADVEGTYSTLDLGFYSYGVGAGPRVLIAEGDSLATSVSYMWRKEVFGLKDPLLSGRDAIDRRTLVNQFFFWGKSGFAGLGGGHQRNSSVAQEHKYDSYSGRLVAGSEIGPGILLDGGLDYTRTKYLKIDRSESTAALSIGVGKFWKWIGFRISGAYVSNRALAGEERGFTFQKSVAGLDVRFKF